MKTIHIGLSIGSINKAIRDLGRYRERLESRTETLVEKLTDESEEIAQSAFGGSVKVSGTVDGNRGTIEAKGKAVPFLEFGAGLTTMEDHPLADNSPVPVREWAYSELAGSGEGYATGKWHFGGQEYQYVVPRHGLLDARDHIANTAEETARRVFGK